MHKEIKAGVYAIIAVIAVLIMIAVCAGAHENSEEERSTLSEREAALRYPYRQLSEREQMLYTVLYRGIQAHKEQIVLPDTFTASEYERVYLLVSMQEPEFFYLDDVYELSERMNTANIHYVADKDSAERMLKNMEAEANEILSGLEDWMTEGEQQAYLHDAIAERCEYIEPTMPDSAYTALVSGGAKCEGYAKAYVYLCRLAGMDAMCVTGESGRGVKHVWNIAKIDENYYNIDVTWDDDDAFEGKIVHSCFAMPDEMFYDHEQDGVGFTPPICTANDENYYYRRGLQMQDTDHLKGRLAEWGMSATRGVMEFQCPDPSVYYDTVTMLRWNRSIVPLENIAREVTYWNVVPDDVRQVVMIIFQ